MTPKQQYAVKQLLALAEDTRWGEEERNLLRKAAEWIQPREAECPTNPTLVPPVTEIDERTPTVLAYVEMGAMVKQLEEELRTCREKLGTCFMSRETFRDHLLSIIRFVGIEVSQDANDSVVLDLSCVVRWKYSELERKCAALATRAETSEAARRLNVAYKDALTEKDRVIAAVTSRAEAAEENLKEVVLTATELQTAIGKVRSDLEIAEAKLAAYKSALETLNHAAKVAISTEYGSSFDEDTPLTIRLLDGTCDATDAILAGGPPPEADHA